MGEGESGQGELDLGEGESGQGELDLGEGESGHGELDPGVAGQPRQVGCRFCEIVAGESPAHVVTGDDATLAFLDIRPLFPGHTLLVPRGHYETLPDLPSDLVEPLFSRAQALAAAMESVLGAGGSFVALNNRVSQSVPHLHVHVVPRRKKDGLRGFFWPRTRYSDDAEAAAVAARLSSALDHRYG